MAFCAIVEINTLLASLIVYYFQLLYRKPLIILYLTLAKLVQLQYKLLHRVSNNIEVYEEPVPRTKKIPHCAVRFDVGEEN